MDNDQFPHFAMPYFQIASTPAEWACFSVIVCKVQVGTPEYNQEYEAVRFYGDANRTDSRDPYQQESPYFWADDVCKSPLAEDSNADT